METTTIQVRKDQAEDLKEMARENGNYKTVIDRLLEGYNDTTSGQTIDVEDARLLSEHLERAVAPYFADLAGVDDASEIYDADVNADVDTEALAESLQEHIDYPEQQDTAEIVQRLEDLETRLPAKVAQELQHG